MGYLSAVSLMLRRTICGLTLLVVYNSGSIRAQEPLLLEDFSSMRLNGEALPIWQLVESEDPGQQMQIGDHALHVIGAPSNCKPSGGCGVYITFLPHPYISPLGFIHHYIRSGKWDPNENRLSFWLRCSRSAARRPDGGPVLEFGTYVKNPIDTEPNNQGAHYYHQLDMNMYAGRWSLYILNRVPQHLVSDDPNHNYPEDPSYTWPAKYRIHYFDGLTRFYYDTLAGDNRFAGMSCEFKDFYFDKVSAEPDTYVSSINVVHNGKAYEVTWAAPKGKVTKYEVRYSTHSMKTSGFESGRNGGIVSSTGSAYTGVIWTSPRMSEQNSFYLAIRPLGLTAFTEVSFPGMDSSNDPNSRAGN
jgi:hypothetical protein